MIRDFSEQAKNNFLHQIDEINAETYNFLTDFIGDTTIRFQSWIGRLDIKDYMDSLDDYHKKVLDKNNTTKKELEQIFATVEYIDQNYGFQFEKLEDDLKILTDTLEGYANIIQPGSEMFTSKQIREFGNSSMKKLQNAEKEVDLFFAGSYEYLRSKTALNTIRDMGSNILSFLSDMNSFCLNVVNGEWGGAVSDTWKMVNAPIKIGQDLVALATVGIAGVGSHFGMKKGMQKDFMDAAEDFQNRDGIEDELEKTHGYKKLARGAETINNLSSTYDTVSSIKNLHEGMFEKKKKEDITKLSKYLNEQKNELKILKYMNTASDPEEGVDNVVKSVVKKGKLSGLILDVDGLMKDWGEEIIHTEETIVSHFADLSAKTVPRFK